MGETMFTMEILKQHLTDARRKIPQCPLNFAKPVLRKANLGQNPGTEHTRFVSLATREFVEEASLRSGLANSFKLQDVDRFLNSIEKLGYDKSEAEICGHGYPVLVVRKTISDLEWEKRIAEEQERLNLIYQNEEKGFEKNSEYRKRMLAAIANKNQTLIGPLMPTVAHYLKTFLELRHATNPQVDFFFDEQKLYYVLSISSDDERHGLGKKVSKDHGSPEARGWLGFAVRLAKNNGRKSSIIDPEQTEKMKRLGDEWSDSLDMG